MSHKMKIVPCAQFVVLLVVAYSALSPVRADCGKQHQCGPCRRHWDPVCASDGKTYSNSCIFSCVRKNCNAGLEIVHGGECGGGSTESQENEVEERDDDYLFFSSEENDDDDGDEEEGEEDDEDDDDRRKRRSLKHILRLNNLQ